MGEKKQGEGAQELLDATDEFFSTISEDVVKYKSEDDPNYKNALSLTGLIAECLKLMKMLKDDEPKEKRGKVEKKKSYLDLKADKARELVDAHKE